MEGGTGPILSARHGPMLITHACRAPPGESRAAGGGWGDGSGPPGVPTGLPCQAPVAAFIIANALSMTLTIDACRLVGTVQTSCLYWHPEHLPSKPKLTQAPSRPTFYWPRRTLPLSHSSKMDMPG